jgi:hypothetical protein
MGNVKAVSPMVGRKGYPGEIQEGICGYLARLGVRLTYKLVYILFIHVQESPPLRTHGGLTAPRRSGSTTQGSARKNPAYWAVQTYPITVSAVQGGSDQGGDQPDPHRDPKYQR